MNDEELFKFLKSLGLFEEEKTSRSNKTATVNIYVLLLNFFCCAMYYVHELFIKRDYGRFSKIEKIDSSFRGLNS